MSLVVAEQGWRFGFGVGLWVIWPSRGMEKTMEASGFGAVGLRRGIASTICCVVKGQRVAR